MHGVEAGVGELGADARILERRLEHLLAQALAVGLPVLDLAALAEGDGVGVLVALRELGAPDAVDAHRDAVVDEALVVDHGERVALLDVEEGDRPLVDLLQLGRQRIGEVFPHDGAPERRADHGALLHAAHGARLGVAADRYRVVVEAEDHVVGGIALVGQVVEVGRVERILVDEEGVAVPRADVAQGELLAWRAVAARGGEQLREQLRLAARDVEPLLVEVGDLHQVAPLRGVEAHVPEGLQVEEVAVVAEEAVAAEERQEPLHAPRVDAPHRGDLVAPDLGDVEQAADLDRRVGDDDALRDGERHERDDRPDERGEPRREVAPLVEQVQPRAQQREQCQDAGRKVDRAAVEPIFVAVLHVVIVC